MNEQRKTVNVEASYPILYTEKDIEILFNCKREKAYKLMNNPLFPSFTVNAKKYVERNNLIRWTKQQGKNIISPFISNDVDEYKKSLILYTVNDIKNIFNCGINQAYTIMKDMDMKGFEIGKIHYINRDDLLD